MDQEDPYQPLKYECTVLHMSMAIIDQLNDRHVAPQTPQFTKRLHLLQARLNGDIWKVVGRIRTASQMGSLSLDRINGESYVCLLKRPNTIVFQRLDDGARATLECRNVENYGQAVSIFSYLSRLQSSNRDRSMWRTTSA